MWKHFLSNYLSFNKRERTGIFILLCSIIFFLLIPFFYPYLIKPQKFDSTDFEKAIASLKIKEAESLGLYAGKNQGKYNDRYYNQSVAASGYSAASKAALFYFDPNSTSTADWKRLGIRDKTIATIQNYLSKGGKFLRKEDIGKIWGLREDEVKRLMPFVQIKADFSKASTGKIFEKKAYKTAPGVVDINIADTTEFIALPGIGSKLSQRIILFREKLGGFYKVDQVAETYGLPDSTFQKIKPLLRINNAEVKQININVATIDEMKSHPYIRFALANAIVQYRIQHGNYTNVTDIKRIMTITEEIFNRVAPYLTVK